MKKVVFSIPSKVGPRTVVKMLEGSIELLGPNRNYRITEARLGAMKRKI